MDKETTEQARFTQAEIKTAYMEGYDRGEADGAGYRPYDTGISEAIQSELDWNRAAGYDAGFADHAGTAA